MVSDHKAPDKREAVITSASEFGLKWEAALWGDGKEEGGARVEQSWHLEHCPTYQSLNSALSESGLALEEEMGAPAEVRSQRRGLDAQGEEENFVVEMKGRIARGAGQAVLSALVGWNMVCDESRQPCKTRGWKEAGRIERGFLALPTQG